MSTKTHDDLIKESLRWAEALGYEIVEHHLGTDTGADAVFGNQFNEEVVLEVITARAQLMNCQKVLGYE